MIEREVAQALLDIGAVGFSPQTPKTFKSGIVSPVYVDNRTVPFHPEAWHTIVRGFQSVLENQSIRCDVIAGMAVGGVPHSAALAYATHRPSVFVRKEAKEHGLKNRVEGGDVNGKHVVMIEDLVTTGGSSLSGVGALREAGAVVEDLLAIVSYGFNSSVDAFATANVRLHTLTTFPVILDIAVSTERFDQNTADLILDWLDDPHGWAERHGHR